jgi:hydrogenase nickel incorporation protein HypA/HybF
VHEMSIANSVLEAVRKEAARYPGSRPSRVGLRIGELAGIDCDSLRFCFEALVKDSDLEPLELAIEACPLQYRCRQCAQQFRVREYDLHCPACGSEAVDFVSGDELDMAYLEVGEDEPCTVGKKSSE